MVRCEEWFRTKKNGGDGNLTMTNKNCYDCCMFITNVELRELNREFGDETFPLDVEWKNCLQGPDAYLNCRKRTEGRKL
jgi:hypothetical protein